MTRTRGQRGRHRRNRDRAPDALTAETTPTEESVDQPAPQPAGPDGSVRREAVPHRTAPDSQRDPRVVQERPSAPAPRGQGSGMGQPGNGRPGGGRGNRRRPARRQPTASSTNRVLKAKAPITGTGEPVIRRRLDQISGPEGPILGCPMLTRTRIGLPVTGAHPAPRCSLAWALHSETEASYCMETPDLTQCWKTHPERLDEIRERLEERSAAD